MKYFWIKNMSIDQSLAAEILNSLWPNNVKILVFLNSDSVNLTKELLEAIWNWVSTKVQFHACMFGVSISSDFLHKFFKSCCNLEWIAFVNWKLTDSGMIPISSINFPFLRAISALYNTYTPEQYNDLKTSFLTSGLLGQLDMWEITDCAFQFEAPLIEDQDQKQNEFHSYKSNFIRLEHKWIDAKQYQSEIDLFDLI